MSLIKQKKIIYEFKFKRTLKPNNNFTNPCWLCKRIHIGENRCITWGNQMIYNSKGMDAMEVCFIANSKTYKNFYYIIC